ncbi:hypothetical protein, partial [Jannaschia formosa]|uniref:hypothetical protein n=1 Tax=Jannaschia formosa TaxID=2259592 RepID=UPI0014312A9B
SGDGTIDIRRIPAATVEALLASGEAGYDRARGVISLDRDGDGVLEDVVFLTPGTRIGYEDLYWA